MKLRIPELACRLVALAIVVGASCSVPDAAQAAFVCPNDCSGHGSCEFSDWLDRDSDLWPWERHCVCDPGWTGADCSLCVTSDVCPGRNVCRGGRCMCRLGWEGGNCEKCYSSIPCRPHGRCYDGACICDAGWSGIDCKVPAGGLRDPAGGGAVPPTPGSLPPTPAAPDTVPVM